MAAAARRFARGDAAAGLAASGGRVAPLQVRGTFGSVDLEEYVWQRTQDLYAYGALVEEAFSFDVDDEWILHATLRFDDHNDWRLWIFEVVGEEEGEAHRLRYSYHVQRGDVLAFRYDRDEQHQDMPEHKHVGARRIPWGRVTLQDVVDETWELVNRDEQD